MVNNDSSAFLYRFLLLFLLHHHLLLGILWRFDSYSSSAFSFSSTTENVFRTPSKHSTTTSTTFLWGSSSSSANPPDPWMGGGGWGGVARIKTTREDLETRGGEASSPTETETGTRKERTNDTTDDLETLVHTVVQAIDSRKAENIVALRVSHITSLTDCMILCSGNSRPQNQAIAACVQEQVTKRFWNQYKLRGNGVPEGDADSGWIVLDYGDIMVHVMTPKSRLYFDIEGQWRSKGAEYMDVTHALIQPMHSSGLSGGKTENQTTRSTRNTIQDPKDSPVQEEDPFWS